MNDLEFVKVPCEMYLISTIWTDLNHGDWPFMNGSRVAVHKYKSTDIAKITALVWDKFFSDKLDQFCDKSDATLVKRGYEKLRSMISDDLYIAMSMMLNCKDYVIEDYTFNQIIEAFDRLVIDGDYIADIIIRIFEKLPYNIETLRDKLF